MIMSLTILSQGLFSQSQMETLYQAGICDEDGYCIPSLQGLPRSKGFRWLLADNLILASTHQKIKLHRATILSG